MAADPGRVRMSVVPVWVGDGVVARDARAVLARGVRGGFGVLPSLSGLACGVGVMARLLSSIVPGLSARDRGADPGTSVVKNSISAAISADDLSRSLLLMPVAVPGRVVGVDKSGRRAMAVEGRATDLVLTGGGGLDGRIPGPNSGMIDDASQSTGSLLGLIERGKYGSREPRGEGGELAPSAAHAASARAASLGGEARALSKLKRRGVVGGDFFSRGSNGGEGVGSACIRNWPATRGWAFCGRCDVRGLCGVAVAGLRGLVGTAVGLTRALPTT